MSVSAQVIGAAGWTPSTTRMLSIPSRAGSLLRGVSPVQPSLIWPNKSASDELDYSLNAQGWLSDVVGDRLGSASLTAVTPTGNVGDLASPWGAILGGVMVCWLTGGVSGTAYTLVFQIQSYFGRILNQAVQISVD